MSSLIKSDFVTFTPNNKKIIKVDGTNPRILNPNFKHEESKVKEQEDKKKMDDVYSNIKDKQEEAKELLEKAKKEAEDEKKKGFDIGEKAGYEKGYKKGYKEGKQQAEALKKDIEAKKQQQDNYYQELIDQLEPKFSKVVIKLVEKLTGVLIEEKEDIIIYLINEAIRSTEITKEYTINVSDEEYEYVIEHQEDILNINNPKINIDIISNSKLKKGQCFIESEYGIVDSSIDTQLSELISNIKLLAN
ncbi:MAG: FliH/SctL family protein [Eubacteriales bacterium]